MPSARMSIGVYEHGYNFCLSEVQLPSTLESISQNAFYLCINLKKITFPLALTGISNYAFSGCSALSEIHVLPTNPPTLGTAVFSGLPASYIIYVPVGTGETYKSAAGWSAYSEHILEEGQTVTKAMQRKFASDALKAEETEIEEKR